jgi:hypothetical protein
MIRVLISEAAFAAIASTIDGAASADQQRNTGAGLFGSCPAGMVPVFLPKEVVNAFHAMRHRGESLSAAIERFVQHHGAQS